MGKYKDLLCGVRKKKKQKEEEPYKEEERKPDDNFNNLNKECKDKEQGDDRQANKIFNININAGNVSIAGGIIREREEHSDSAFESCSNSAVVKDQLLTEVYTPVNETENGLLVPSSQDSGIGSQQVSETPITSQDSETDEHACKSETKKIDKIQYLPETFQNSKLDDSIYKEDKGDEISSTNQGLTNDSKNMKAESQQREFSETEQKRNNSLSGTVVEDGPALSMTNCNNVDKLTQFSNVSKRPFTSESLPETNSTSDSQLFGSQGGQEHLSGFNIEERSKKIGPGQSGAVTDHMNQDQSSSQSVNCVLSRAANDITDQAIQEEESRSGEDDVDQDADVYNTATPSDGRPQNSEQKDESTEKKGVDGAVVSDIIKEMRDFGKDSMCKNYGIAMTPESNNEVKIEMGHEIGSTGRSVTEHMANIAIQSFRA